MSEHAPAAEQVPCEVCLKEIPVSEATTSEATDYIAYFCGLDCYAKWKEKNAQQRQGEVKPPQK